ncbi:hypothetical protein KSP40_PGU021660 [Platanthera guangdongensis]|uniref:Secreted protein n=1 Tax=Platanthera guangdongensis TaxID=2320717 RepID=A0ABR2LEK1_9ASPA
MRPLHRSACPQTLLLAAGRLISPAAPSPIRCPSTRSHCYGVPSSVSDHFRSNLVESKVFVMR